MFCLFVFPECLLCSWCFQQGNRDGRIKIFCGPILLSDWSVVKALARRVAELHLQIVNIFDATKDDWALDIGS